MDPISASTPETVAEHHDNKKIILEVLVGIILLCGLLVLVSNKPEGPVQPLPTPLPESDEVNLLPVADVISDQTANPADSLPDTNPFNDAYANPFQ